MDPQREKSGDEGVQNAASKGLRPEDVPGQTLEEKKLWSEIQNLQSANRKALAEAANAEAQNVELTRKRSFYERVLSTTQATIVLALFTFVFQIAQFGFTARENRRSEEDKQWRATINGVSFDGGDKSVGAILNLETFLDTPLYGDQAKAMIAAILPFLKDNDAFDHAYADLYEHTSVDDRAVYLYSIAKKVSRAYKDDAKLSYSDQNIMNAAPIAIRDELSKVVASHKPVDEALLAETERREWQVDTIAHGLVDLWHRQGIRSSPAGDSNEVDLQDVIIRYDGDMAVDLRGIDFGKAYLRHAYLHSVDFSDGKLQGSKLMEADLGSAKLQNTHLDGAQIDGANLDKISVFEGSTWADVPWWKAAKISPALCDFLKVHGKALPPATVSPCAIEAN